MHKLIFFEHGSALTTDDWRLASREVRDLADTTEILETCRLNLEQIDEVARNRLESAREEGFACGFAEGHAAGGKAAAEQLAQFLQETACEQAQCRVAVGRLALDIARRLFDEIDIERTIETLVLRGMEDLRRDSPMAVRVPCGLACGVAHRLDKAGVAVRVIEDPKLDPDACAFEMAGGSVHASVTFYLETLAAAIGAVEADLEREATHVA